MNLRLQQIIPYRSATIYTKGVQSFKPYNYINLQNRSTTIYNIGVPQFTQQKYNNLHHRSTTIYTIEVQ